MANRAPNDEDKFVVACKRAIYAGVVIVLVLVMAIMIENIEHSPSDTPSQIISLPQNAPVKQQAVLYNPSQLASDVREVGVGFRVGGQITKMFFAEHDEVKEGDILALLDPAPFEEAVTSAMTQLRIAENNYISHLPTSSFNAIEAARTDVETAQHTYEEAHAELEERGRLLIAGQLDNVYNDDVQDEHDTRLDLEKTRRELVQQQDAAANNPDRDDDKAAIRLAQNNLARAEVDLTDTQLLAPSAGIITSRIGNIGDTVAADAPVYSLSVFRTANP